MAAFKPDPTPQFRSPLNTNSGGRCGRKAWCVDHATAVVFKDTTLSVRDRYRRSTGEVIREWAWHVLRRHEVLMKAQYHSGKGERPLLWISQAGTKHG
jgi:hypothetical protein